MDKWEDLVDEMADIDIKQNWEELSDKERAYIVGLGANIYQTTFHTKVDHKNIFNDNDLLFFCFYFGLITYAVMEEMGKKYIKSVACDVARRSLIEKTLRTSGIKIPVMPETLN